MAFVFDPNNKKKAEEAQPTAGQQPGGPTALSSGQGSVITGQNPTQAPSTPNEQKASSSGRFTNIQNFVKANDPTQLTNQVTGKIGDAKTKAMGQLQNAQTAVDKSAQSTGDAVAAAKSKLEGANQGLNGAYAYNGGQVNDDSFNANLDNYKQGLGMQYTGVDDLGDQANLRTQAQGLQEMGKSTQNASGRSALLNRFFGNPQYAQGQNTLDTLLLGSQRPALQKTAAQANAFGGELDTARRAALGKIGQARQGVTDTVQQAKDDVLGQVGNAQGAITQRAQSAQSIRDLLRKQDAELQLQDDANLPSITGDKRTDMALNQAMQSGFMTPDQIEKYKALQGRAANVGFTSRDLLNNTLLSGNESGDQLNAIAASGTQASRIKALQGLVGQNSSYNPYSYNDADAEGRVGAREDEIFKALGNTDFDFSKDYNQKQDVIATAAKMGLINPGMAATYGLAQGEKALYQKLGISDEVNSTPLKYLTAQNYADSMGSAANQWLDKVPGLKKVGSLTSGAVNNVGGAISSGLSSIASKFCFAPWTEVQMADGSFKQIQYVRTGDELLDGGKVYKMAYHIVHPSQVFDYAGVIVTGDHAVLEDDIWKRVKDSDIAVPAFGKTEFVFSLSNEKHKILTRNGTFADFDEVDNSEALSDEECLKVLNRSK